MSTVRKKIVFIGPAGTGKTSIKKTFFEKYSPISLLKEPLNPSRGVNTSNYNLFNSNLGLFDLAGQENNLWLSDANKSVLNNSNLIICIFDIHNSVESIVQFLLNVYQILVELNLDSCRVVAFMNKIDLVSDSYVKRKIKTIREFFTIQHPRGDLFEIFQTSITKEHYFYTFKILLKLLKNMISYNGMTIQKTQFANSIYNTFLILDGVQNSSLPIKELALSLNIIETEALSLLKTMQEKRIITALNEMNTINLSDSAYFLKFGLEHQNDKEREENLEFETFYFFFILNEWNA